MAADDLSLYIIPNDTPISKLDCTEAFNGLTDKEKLYAHHFGRASWEGALICLLQCSPESPGIFLLLQRVLGEETLSSLRQSALTCGLTDDEFNSFLVYSAAFFSNLGNYKSFGDTKFIPNLSSVSLYKLITCSRGYANHRDKMEELWSLVSDRMFSLDNSRRQLGFPPEGLTTYYSCNCNKEDAQLINEFMLEKVRYNYYNSSWNTSLTQW
jgi:dipeptidyl-peptidase-3